VRLRIMNRPPETAAAIIAVMLLTAAGTLVLALLANLAAGF
jgi:hypothetical protein